VLAFSAIACFADVPPARFFGTNDPFLAVVCWFFLLGAVLVYVTVRLIPSLSRGSAAPERPAILRTGAR